MFYFKVDCYYGINSRWQNLLCNRLWITEILLYISAAIPDTLKPNEQVGVSFLKKRKNGYKVYAFLSLWVLRQGMILHVRSF